MSQQHKPSDQELQLAIKLLDDANIPGISFDRVSLMLSAELASRERARRVVQVMESVGPHCTIAMARKLIEIQEADNAHQYR